MVRGGEARLCVTADRELYINRAGGEERRLRQELVPLPLYPLCNVEKQKGAAI